MSTGQRLPTGTVTFLFTDIEGSTRHWDAHATAMQPALAHHDHLVRQAIETNAGHVFKTVGDAFCAAFPTAHDALAATVDAQFALHEQDWVSLGLSEPVRVRMALHAGPAEHRDSDYFGPTLNRVARLLAIGYGGQVLLSEVTAGLVRDHLLDTMHLRDLGAHRLRGLQRAEHVFQLVLPPLPADFPPLQSLASRPHNLPVLRDPLIGRERELGEVKVLLRHDHVGLVTLTGPGGTGKTRLALQLAAELLDQFDQGVFFVSIAPITDAALVPPAIAQALGVSATSGRDGDAGPGERGGRGVLDLVKDYLREQRLLLVLDNLEQVTAAGPLVVELLAACPHVKVLATSRVALRVSGERVYQVPPLALPDVQHPPPPEQLAQYDAVHLFIERAQAVRPDFRVTNDNARAVAELCHRLDGLPLAIELAAARARLFAPPALLARLQRRLPLLTGGAQDLPARQQTLRNTIAWSYGLLAPDEQWLFCWLSVFDGGGALEAVEAVGQAIRAAGTAGADRGTAGLAGELVDLIEGLDSLVAHSLLGWQELDGEPRLTMLQTIQEYARERLAESADEPAAGAAHAAYYGALIERATPALMGPHLPAWLDRLAVEHDNLRAALTWHLAHEPDTGLRLVTALDRYWRLRAHQSEARRWFGDFLERVSSDSPLRGDALYILAQVIEDLEAEPAAPLAVYGAALTAYRQLGNRRGEANALRRMSGPLMLQGDLARAEAACQEIMAIYRELQDEAGVARAARMLAGLAMRRGDLTDATAWHESLADLRRRASDPFVLEVGLLEHARLARLQREYEPARQLLEESLALSQANKDRSSMSLCLGGLGEIAYFQHDERARSYFRDGLLMAQEVGRASGVAFQLTMWALLEARRGAYRRAVQLLGAATGIDFWVTNNLDEDERRDHEAAVAAARNTLGEEAFAAAWAIGQRLSRAQAVAYALEEAPPPVTG